MPNRNIDRTTIRKKLCSYMRLLRYILHNY
jgi:hypothetical protein